MPAKLAPGGRIPVARIASTDTRPRLSADSGESTAVLASAVDDHRAALVASGGLCTPVESLYSLPDIIPEGSTRRPVRDALVRLEADRGGFRYQPPATLADVADGTSLWTEATDADPGASTKNVLTIDCADEEEVVVDAVVRWMRFGNFRGRFQPEQVDQWWRTLAVAHARLAEETLLDAIDAGSTNTSTGELLGTARDVLAALDRAGSQYRDRQRLDDRDFLTVIMPAWLRSMMRADLARQIPGDQALAHTDAEIDGLFQARNFSPVWSLDAEAQTDTQGVGPVIGWNDTAVIRMFAPGTWCFVDGGTLDLGVVRDSTLIGTNDAELFLETFEAAVQLGTESLRITADVCSLGATSSTIEITPCTTGS